jgi:beta-lactamase class A
VSAVTAAPATATPAPSPGLPLVAWTAEPVALLSEAGDATRAVAHLGPGFPVSPTSATDYYLGDVWLEVRWRTPGRSEAGWLAATALTFEAPGGIPRAGVDALDLDLAAYLSSLKGRVGVEVYDVTRGTIYDFDEKRQFTTASSVKVPIMVAFLARCEAEGREPTAHERTLLAQMIESSTDSAATALWSEIGGAPGLATFMKSAGIEGLTPNGSGWSWSTMSPAAMVELLAQLHGGTILNQAHRDLALYLMEHVIASQRIGVADTAPAGASVAMKIGRWWYDAKRGGTVMSSSGIVTLGGETYIISVYTDHNPSMPKAEATVRHICAEFASLLVPAPPQ